MKPVYTVTVDLDRKRTARLTLLELSRFKRATDTEERPGGIDLTRGVDGGVESWSVDEWVAAFQAILSHDDPDLTTDELAGMIDGDAYQRLFEAFFDLLGHFFPERADDEGDQGEDPQKPTA